MKTRLLTGTMIAALAAGATFAQAKNEHPSTAGASVLPAQGFVTGTQSDAGYEAVFEQSSEPKKPVPWAKSRTCRVQFS
jgi:hypothetical protein